MHGDVVCEINEACVHFLKLYTHTEILQPAMSSFFYFILLYMISEKSYSNKMLI